MTTKLIAAQETPAQSRPAPMTNSLDRAACAALHRETHINQIPPPFLFLPLHPNSIPAKWRARSTKTSAGNSNTT